MTEQERYMKKALAQAAVAAKKGEVPVGAVVVHQGRIIARGHNLRESAHDPTAHAELLAMQRAAKKLGGWRLSGCTLYVTLEPCPMCAGAAINARIDEIVFGAYDPKAGCCGTLHDLPRDPRFNHRCKVTGGVLETKCSDILRNFFKNRRQKS
ncbi:MAG: tRNA adenosine(34) deaminase TadA [Clostridia bacterium]|nr:tRNA adenosine(34) deaminase TadA [Clostridia bacterium]MBQ9988399.1 tRNA adenosine(34) deaminase TadA [Clostridia bacterium]